MYHHRFDVIVGGAGPAGALAGLARMNGRIALSAWTRLTACCPLNLKTAFDMDKSG